MKFLLAKKMNMTQIFGEDGAVYPATLLQVAPTFVTQIKTKEKDGYFAVQVGWGVRKEKNIKKPVLGHLKGVTRPLVIKEFKVNDLEIARFNIGDKIGVDTFAVGEKVVVTGLSKGKGFQGVVKRHGFHGGPRSHGQKHSEREPGSIGGGGRDGGRVAKGKRMAGRMGSDRVTVKNLKILALDTSNNQILISGAVPGRRGTTIELRSMN